MTAISLLKSPNREYIFATLLTAGLIAHYVLHADGLILLIAAIVGSIIPLWKAVVSIYRLTISIETANAFALVVSFATVEYALSRLENRVACVQRC
jgi:hypothetical protein